MKRVLIFLVIFLFLLITTGFFYFLNKGESVSLISPLPEKSSLEVYKELTVTPIKEPTLPPSKINKFVSGEINKFVSGEIKITTKPLVLGTSKDKNLPEFLAESVVAVDLTSGRTLITKNEKERRQIASLTKVMTAIIALEHSSLNDLITINEEVPKIGEQMMGLSTGEKLTVEELLYGLLLYSANDAAEALALGTTGGDRQLFINLMNERVKELKLKDTYFANPSGLDEDNKQSTYSTANDLLIIAKYALENFPVFREIVGTQSIEFTQNYRRKAYSLVNEINLTNGIPGVAGVKAGFTDMAGYCLITLAKRDSHDVLGALLGSLDTRKDAMVLYDYSFKKIGGRND